jgi:hypothetical protein
MTVRLGANSVTDTVREHASSDREVEKGGLYWSRKGGILGGRIAVNEER